jgi:voltage-gated potassium channel
VPASISTLKQIIERTDTPAGRAFDFATEGLIVLSMVSFLLETLPNLSESAMRTLSAIESVIVILFTFEYLARVAVATPRHAYVFSFFGMIDLISVLPFSLGTGVDLRALRSFRLLRLFRVFKLGRLR